VDGKTTGSVAVGEIVGILKPWNPLSKRAKVLIQADGEVITTFVDLRHIDYVRKKYSNKSRVAVGYYGGEWHLGVPDTPPGRVDEIEVIASDMESIGLSEILGEPIIESDGLPTVVDDGHEAVIDDIIEHREYIRQVESDTKEHGDELLAQLGLSHLRSKPEPKAPVRSVAKAPAGAEDGEKLDRLIDLNGEILVNQKEMLWLLKEQLRQYAGRARDKLN
jgi:hypothetical protein